MLEFLAAFPTGVWVAALLIVAGGGLCAALDAHDRTGSADEHAEAPAPAPTSPDLEDVPWDRDALDHDPLWAGDQAMAS